MSEYNSNSRNGSGPKMIYIPGNVPSSKNSKEVSVPTTKDGRVIKTKTGKRLTIVRNSKTVTEYLKNYEHYYKNNADLFKQYIEELNLEKPYNVCFQFIRDSKRQFDYINAAQIVQDLMVKHGWLHDDNADEMKPVFLDYSYDKENTGVIIMLIKNQLI